MNQLRKAVRDYLVMRRGLGFKLAKHEGRLQEFVSFLARKRSSRIEEIQKLCFPAVAVDP
jgi:integrase/recombinase XerD